MTSPHNKFLINKNPQFGGDLPDETEGRTSRRDRQDRRKKKLSLFLSSSLFLSLHEKPLWKSPIFLHSGISAPSARTLLYSPAAGKTRPESGGNGKRNSPLTGNHMPGTARPLFPAKATKAVIIAGFRQKISTFAKFRSG